MDFSRVNHAGHLPKAGTGPLEPAAGPKPAHAPAPAAKPAAEAPPPAADLHALFAAHAPYEDHDLPGLDEHAQHLVRELKERGDWHAGEPSLAQNVHDFLAKGGSPKVAKAILEQVYHPRSIHQLTSKNTCAAAAAQELLAAQDPAKYFKMAADLVTTGHARIFPGNHGFVVNEENRAYIAEHHRDAWHKVNASMQAAMMEWANGFEAKGGDLYHMASDQSYDTHGKHDDAHHGVSLDQLDGLAKVLVGAPVLADQFHPMNITWGHFRWGVPNSPAERQKWVDHLGSSVQGLMAKHPDGFLMTIQGGKRDHAVLVTGYDPATRKVTYHDPRRMDEKDIEISLDELSHRIAWPDGNVGDVGTSASSGTGMRGGRLVSAPVSPPPPPPPTTTY